MRTQITWVESLCEEFSDWVLYDSRKKSIIINISIDYFEILKKELGKFGFCLIHESRVTIKEKNDNITCVFLHMK